MSRYVLAQSTFSPKPDIIPVNWTLASCSWADLDTGQLPVKLALGSLRFLPNLAYNTLLQGLELTSGASRQPCHPACYCLFPWTIQEFSSALSKQGWAVASDTWFRGSCWTLLACSPISLKFPFSARYLPWKLIGKWPYFNWAPAVNWLKRRVLNPLKYVEFSYSLWPILYLL